MTSLSALVATVPEQLARFSPRAYLLPTGEVAGLYTLPLRLGRLKHMHKLHQPVRGAGRRRDGGQQSMSIMLVL